MNRRNRKKEMTRGKLTCDNTNTQSNDLLHTATIIMSIVISSDVPFTAVPVSAGVADAQSTPPVEVKDDESIPAAGNQQVQPCPSTVAE